MHTSLLGKVREITAGIIMFASLMGMSTLVTAQEKAPVKIWSTPQQGVLWGSQYVATPDGGLAVITAISGSSKQKDILFRKLNSSGQLEWQKEYGGSGAMQTNFLYDGFKVNRYAMAMKALSDGYIVTATTTSNNGDVPGNKGGSDIWVFRLDLSGNLVWSKSYGGSLYDYVLNINTTSDGGFILVGTILSEDGDITGYHPGQMSPFTSAVGSSRSADAWVVKLDAQGGLQWQKALGGSKHDIMHDVVEDPQGGYLVVGGTFSFDGDVLLGGSTRVDKPYEASSPDWRTSDMWLVKLKSNGDIDWQKAYGTDNYAQFEVTEEATMVHLKKDGTGYIIGSTMRTPLEENTSISEPKGGSRCDGWILLIDKNGNKVNDFSVGSAEYDLLYNVFEDTDGNLVISGSVGTDQDGEDLHTDFPQGYRFWHWAAKMTPTGNTIWKTREMGDHVIPSMDGGYFSNEIGKFFYCNETIKLERYICDGEVYDFFGESLDKPGVYTKEVEVENACPIKYELTLTQKEAYTPTVEQVNGELIGQAGFDSYQWLFQGNPLYGGDHPSIQPALGGAYKLQVVNEFGCKSEFATNVLDIENCSDIGAIQDAWVYGGSSVDNGFAIRKVTSGGYIIAGSTTSLNINNTSIPTGTAANFYVVRTADNGDTLWAKAYVSGGADIAYDVKETTDKGFIIVGSSVYNVNEHQADNSKRPIPGGGAMDGWIIKTDADGNIQWQQFVGGSAADRINTVVLTSDGGYLLGGNTASSDGNITQPTNGAADGLLVKLSANGGIEWQRSYGGGGADEIFRIQPTPDGGFITVGNSTANANTGTLGGTARPTAASTNDFWIMKVNATGAIQWQKLYGGTGVDIAYAIAATTDGNYVVSGSSNATSIDGTLTGIARPGGVGNDYWMLKIDGGGEIIWNKIFGGTGVDNGIGYDILVEEDGYIMVGASSSVDGDKTEAKGNLVNYWVVKAAADKGNLMWEKTLGGSLAANAYSVEKIEKGYLILGGTSVTNAGLSGGKGSTDIWVARIADCVICSYVETKSICGAEYQFGSQLLKASGKYSETFTSSTGCDSIVVLNLILNPIDTTIVERAICTGEEYDFYGQLLKEAGTYYHQIPSVVTGCDSTIQLNLVVNALPVPIVTSNGNILQVEGFSSYQWYKDNEAIANATGATYTYLQGGAYSVRVTNANGCSAISAPVVVSVTGDVGDAELLPNPARDYVTVRFPGVVNTFYVTIISGESKRLITQQYANTNTATIDIRKLPEGVYLLRVNGTDGSKKSFRLIKGK